MMLNNLSMDAKEELIVQLLKKKFKNLQAPMLLEHLRVNPLLLMKTEFVKANTPIERQLGVSLVYLAEHGRHTDAFAVDIQNIRTFSFYTATGFLRHSERIIVFLDLNDEYFLDNYYLEEGELPPPMQQLVDETIEDSVIHGIKTLIDQALFQGNKERFIFLTNQLKEYESDIYIPF